MGNNNVVPLRKKTTETQHTFSVHNKEHIAKSQFCGCFNCCTVFRANEVTGYCFSEDDFNDDGNLIDENAIETTGECPSCGCSSVLPDSVVDITPRIILTMCDEWESDDEEDGDVVDQDPDSACDNCAEAYGTEPCVDCENYDGGEDSDPDADDNEEEDPED